MLIPGALAVEAPATNEQISNLQEQLGRDLPRELHALYLTTNGLVAGHDNSVTIYAVEEIYERNDTYRVFEYAPDFIAIGDDGGGQLLLYSFLGDELYWVDAGSGVQPSEPESMKIGGLAMWIGLGMPGVPERPSTTFKTGEVLLIREPSAGLTTLWALRREFGPQMASKDLLKLLKGKKPAQIVRSFPLGAARERCARINRADDCLRVVPADDQE